MNDWDHPLFKRLARNDTGEAPGHQAGIVITKTLVPYFPWLPAATAASPAPSVPVQAVLAVDGSIVGRVSTRYQSQTWGATRPPEHRLTGNLAALRDQAHAGDYLVIQRALRQSQTYRLDLVRQGTPNHARLAQLVGSRRAGLLEGEALREADLREAQREEEQSESAEFVLIDPRRRRVETTRQLAARLAAFARTVGEEYNDRCAICGEGLRAPTGAVEIEAAHVVPRSENGTDDARNGLALCRRHHWAFDRGLFGIDPERRTVRIPAVVRALAENAELTRYEDQPIREARAPRLRVHPEALRWHMEHRLLR